MNLRRTAWKICVWRENLCVTKHKARSTKHKAQSTKEMSNTLLITGGAGFIGSAVVRYLIRETDYWVVNLDRLTYAKQSLDSVAVFGYVRNLD